TVRQRTSHKPRFADCGYCTFTTQCLSSLCADGRCSLAGENATEAVARCSGPCPNHAIRQTDGTCPGFCSLSSQCEAAYYLLLGGEQDVCGAVPGGCGVPA